MLHFLFHIHILLILVLFKLFLSPPLLLFVRLSYSFLFGFYLLCVSFNVLTIHGVNIFKPSSVVLSSLFVSLLLIFIAVIFYVLLLLPFEHFEHHPISFTHILPPCSFLIASVIGWIVRICSIILMIISLIILISIISRTTSMRVVGISAAFIILMFSHLIIIPFVCLWG